MLESVWALPISVQRRRDVRRMARTSMLSVLKPASARAISSPCRRGELVGATARLGLERRRPLLDSDGSQPDAVSQPHCSGKAPL